MSIILYSILASPYAAAVQQQEEEYSAAGTTFNNF